jgi:hypothetical protein
MTDRELLELIAQKVNGMEQKVNGMEQKMTSMEQDIKLVKQDNREIKNSIIRIENDHGEQIKALYDAREVQLDVNDRVVDTLNRIEGKVDRLTLKVSSHDVLLKAVK